MEVRYNEKRGETLIIFDPREVEDSAFLLQMVWEEEWRRGTTVPNLRDVKFFRGLAAAIRKALVKFDYLYLEFVIVFLEESCIEFAEKGLDTLELEVGLKKMIESCPMEEIIH